MKAFGYIGRMLRDLLLAANIIVSACYLVSAYSPYINPAEHRFLSCMGFLFPIFAVLCICFVIGWLVVKPWFALIPLVTMIFGWDSLTTYYSIGGSHKAKGETIKLLTWNTQGKLFSFKEKDMSDNLALNYVLASEADIVCLQEYNAGNEKLRKKVDGAFAKTYPYRQHVKFDSGNGVVCLSRFPIVSSERIRFESKTNGSAMYRIKIDSDTLLLVNNHLESNKISTVDKEEYGRMLKSKSRDTIKSTGKHLFRKLADAAALRAPQADSVAAAIEKNKTKLMVVCGDFNDSPISYAHHTIGRGMTDAFSASGKGVGFTYNDASMYFRIDHIFASEAIRVTECEVDRSIEVSDHYPIWAILSLF